MFPSLSELPEGAGVSLALLVGTGGASDDDVLVVVVVLVLVLVVDPVLLSVVASEEVVEVAGSVVLEVVVVGVARRGEPRVAGWVPPEGPVLAANVCSRIRCSCCCKVSCADGVVVVVDVGSVCIRAG
jgi:hypothetical protein